MPILPTYPGVYVEEIASGTRTITGVPTSVAAFIGRAVRGPTNTETVINSYADYENKFGGLDLNSAMSYAVRDFFLNGGAQAVIGRLYTPATADPDKALITTNTTVFEAVYEGDWGNQLVVRINDGVAAEVATEQGVALAELFNLEVKDLGTGAVETHRNVTVVTGPRQIDNILVKDSDLIRVQTGSLGGTAPTANTAPAAGVDPWTDNTAGVRYPVTTDAAAGDVLSDAEYIGPGTDAAKQGLYLLRDTNIFNLLCLPPEWSSATTGYPAGLVAAAASLCEEERAILLLDPPSDWSNKDDAVSGMGTGIGTTSKNAAMFFPRLKQPNSLRDNTVEEFVPCGAIAGVISRTDSNRGVWKAPAGIDANLNGVPELSVALTDAENGELNPLGLNCLRNFANIGRTVWGARTMKGADVLSSEWKYLPVRRLALYIEETLFRSSKWVVFEPNDEPLWAEIRLSIGAFMHNLFRQGAFQGQSPKEAYLVKCDKETTTQNDIDRGIVNIHVGFAPLKPAEFVILKIQQLAGQTEA